MKQKMLAAMIEPPRERELDAATLLRAQRGEAGACRALVEWYQRPIFALLSRTLGAAGRTSLVEDLAQETFLRAFRALPAFQPGGPARLSTWLLTIATRLALDELKSRRPASEPIESASGVASIDRADAPAERTAARGAIARAVEALGPEFRAAFLLREAHELSYEEIALALGIDVGTVKSRLSRARAALRLALQEHR